jgi:allantoinase
MRRFDLVVLGRVVEPGRVIEEGAVGVKDGVIAAIGQGRNVFEASEVLDFGGCLIVPGGIDAHVHPLSDTREGYLHTTRAAVAGGITAIIDQPLDRGGPPVGSEGLLNKKKLIEEDSLIDVALLGAVTPDLMDKIEDCAQVDIVGFKMLMQNTSPDMPLMKDGDLLEAFTRIAPTGLFAGVHAENDDIIKHNIERLRKEGKNYHGAHSESRPPVSETEAVARACEFAIATRCRLHVFHVSLSRCFEIIERARREFACISAETAPHYLVLSEDELDRIGSLAKINPPLRSKDERLALWDQVRRGNVSFIASDHAPLPFDRKSESIWESESGAPGVETMMPLIFDEGVSKGKIGVEQFSELLSTNVAKVMGLYPRKGLIAPGSDADLAVIDPQAKWTICASDLHQQVGWTPYEGRSVTGRVVATIAGGKVVYKDNEILGHPGDGRFIAAQRLNKGSDRARFGYR